MQSYHMDDLGLFRAEIVQAQDVPFCPGVAETRQLFDHHVIEVAENALHLVHDSVLLRHHQRFCYQLVLCEFIRSYFHFLEVDLPLVGVIGGQQLVLVGV